MMHPSSRAHELCETEFHNSLRARERYHSALKRIFYEARMDYPDIERNILLALANKAIDDSCGPERLVPSPLMLGVVPAMPSEHSNIAEQRKNMEIIAMARVKIEAITAELGVRKSLKKKAIGATMTTIMPGMQALVYREKERPWEGTALVESVEWKAPNVLDDAGKIKPFTMSAVKNYLSPEEAYKVYFHLIWGDPRLGDARFTPAINNELEGLQGRDTWCGAMGYRGQVF